jgi:hypothetical protein
MQYDFSKTFSKTVLHQLLEPKPNIDYDFSG